MNPLRSMLTPVLNTFLPCLSSSSSTSFLFSYSLICYLSFYSVLFPTSQINIIVLPFTCSLNLSQLLILISMSFSIPTPIIAIISSEDEAQQWIFSSPNFIPKPWGQLKVSSIKNLLIRFVCEYILQIELFSHTNYIKL